MGHNPASSRVGVAELELSAFLKNRFPTGSGQERVLDLKGRDGS